MSRIEELNDANIRVVYNDAGDIESLIDNKGRALNIPLVSKDVTGGSIISGANSTLKLPAGETDLSGSIGQQWRLDSPVDAVVASAPTVTDNVASQIASGVAVAYTNTALTFYHGTVGDYIGAGYQNVTQSGASDKDKPIGVQFYTDTQNIEFKLQSFGSKSSLDVFVNGQPISATAYTYTTSGGTKYVKLAFADAQPRLIQANVENVFMGLVVDATASVWKAPRGTEKTLAVIADSWVGGNNSGGIAHSWIYRAALKLGFTQVLNFAQPGTGLVSAGGGGARGVYLDRLAQVVAKSPQKILVCGTVNDCTGSTSLLGPAATALSAALDAAGVPYAICGPQYCNPTLTGSDDVYATNMYNGLSAAAKLTWFSPKGWLTGADNASGNRATYAVGDNMHITAAGQRYWDRRETAALVNIGFVAK